MDQRAIENEEQWVVEKDKLAFDVIIIGGGPAGIATSLTLTASGISNCIVEAKTTPENKPGEAIPPNAKPLFKKLGLHALLQAEKHQIYYGNKSSWGSEKLEQKSFIKDIYGHGYLLDRFYFEKQLRAHLTAFGGELFVGYRLKKVVSFENGVSVRIEDKNTALTLIGKYIVDATGRKASVCQQLGVKKTVIDAQFALTCLVKTSSKVTQEITIEAVSNGWWYAAPQGENHLNLMFFTAKNMLPLRDESALFLAKEMYKSRHISKLVPASNLDLGPVKTMPAGTSRLEIPFGENWLAVGDAAYSYDPISSYGITSALASGMYGGHALASAINGNFDGLLTYRYLMEKAYADYSEKLVQHYALEKRWKESTFW